MKQSLFLEALFKPEELTYVAIKEPKFLEREIKIPATGQIIADYLCLNPLSGRKLDQNVTCYRSWLLEFDELDLDQQLQFIAALEKLIPVRTITYSGNKSYHAIISLSDDIGFPIAQEGIQGYTNIFKALSAAAVNAVMPGQPVSLIDQSNSNCSRYTRLAEGLNSSTGKHQTLVKTGELCSSEQLISFVREFMPKTAKPVISAPTYFGSFEKTLDNQTHLKGLKAKLKVPEAWASSAGNRIHIFRTALWALDKTGVSQEELIDYIHKHTTPVLTQLGYQNAKKKVEDAVKGAYNWKLVRGER